MITLITDPVDIDSVVTRIITIISIPHKTIKNNLNSHNSIIDNTTSQEITITKIKIMIIIISSNKKSRIAVGMEANQQRFNM